MKSDFDHSPDSLFQAVAMHHGEISDAHRSRGFGSDALKVNGKIFAALTEGRLLLKLPRERVDTLVDENLAERFSTGVGRTKKEWATFAPTSAAHWVALSDEARRFVSSQSR